MPPETMLTRIFQFIVYIFKTAVHESRPPFCQISDTIDAKKNGTVSTPVKQDLLLKFFGLWTLSP